MSEDWRDGLSSLSEMAAKFFSLRPDSLSYTDITFTLADTSQVSAHKIILAWASPVFELELFGLPWNESSSSNIQVEDDRGLFRSIIHYIYSPDTLDLESFSDLELWDMLYLSNKYLIKKLTVLVEELLIKRIKTMNHKPSLIQHFQLAKVYSIGKGLEPLIKKKIEKCATEILQSEEILQLDLKDIIDIVSLDDLRASEGEIFEACQKWCSCNEDDEYNQQKLFHKNFEHLINWENLSVDEFEQKVDNKQDILDSNLLLNLRSNYSKLKSETFLRLHMKPIKSLSQVVRKEDLKNHHTEWTKFITEEFYNTRVYISIKSLRVGSFTGESLEYFMLYLCYC